MVLSSTNNISGANGSHAAPSIGKSYATNEVSNLGYGLGRLVKKAFDYLPPIWRQALPPQTSTDDTFKIKRHLKQHSNFPPVFDLSSLNGGNGFLVDGSTSQVNQLGMSVTQADINADGKKDLILGSLQGVYVIFGQANGWPAQINTNSLDGNTGFTTPGVSSYYYLGTAVSFAGDVNGDSRDDVVLGAFQTSPDGQTNRGAAYILFGSANPWTLSFNLSTLNGATDFAMHGLFAGDQLGVCVGSAGDIKNDNLKDIFLGAPGAYEVVGAAYILFGQSNGWPALFNISTLDGTNGFTVLGKTSYGSRLGNDVSHAGDINGDGIADFVLGDPYHAPGGTAYVLFGQKEVWPVQFDLSNLNGMNGFAVNGIAKSSYFGGALSSGDINGDENPDLIMGASSDAPYGKVYIILGPNVSRTFSSAKCIVNLPTSSPEVFFVPFTPVSLSPTPLSSIPSLMPTPELIPFPVPIYVDQPLSAPSPAPVDLTQTIGIATGAGGVVLLGTIAGIILCFKRRKKSCFTEKAEKRNNLEEGSANSSPIIPEQELSLGQKLDEDSLWMFYRGVWRNDPVAIKQLKPQLLAQEPEKFKEAISMLSPLRSPYLVGYCGITADQPYKLALHPIEGTPLRDFLNQQEALSVPWKMRFKIANDISQGLKYLHERNIVHADLKSPHVLLGQLNHARLTDFGLGFLKPAHSSVLWTVPELFANERYTAPSDMYALAIVLWEIASHRLPFEDKKWNKEEIIDHIKQGKREKFAKSTPIRYKKLAKQCWAEAPDQRPSIEESATVLFDLWKLSQDKSEDSDEELEIVPSAAKSSYLTATFDATSQEKNSKPKCELHTQTKFGI